MKEKKPSRALRVTLIVVCVILALVLIAEVFAAAYAHSLSSRLGRVDPNETRGTVDPSTPIIQADTKPEDYTGTIFGEEDLTVPATAAEQIDDTCVNILLIGQDATADSRDIQRSDTMILCTFNPGTKAITMTSFHRDMFLPIPGFWSSKLSHSFRYGGLFGTEYNDGYGNGGGFSDAFKVLNSTLQYNFGVVVDGNVCVDFSSFEQVVDAVGGVDISLTSAEAAELGAMDGRTFSEGDVHLDGRAALSYVRIRSIDSGLARDSRQRILLNSLIEKAKHMSLTELNDLLYTVLPLVTTDLTDAEILGYALKLLPMLSQCTVVSQEVPVDGTFALGWTDSEGGMSIVRVDDMQTNIDLLRKALE